MENANQPEAIDAVYTWVDGGEEGFQERLRGAWLSQPVSPDASSVHPGRFRDNGELRASLRLLHRFAPWIRRILLVTASRPPDWLDSASDRVRVVTHDELFGGRVGLPTFNSNAIELQLHRIEGLSRKFLYFNDDVFLGRPLAREHLLTPHGGQRVFLQDTPIPTDPERGHVHDRSYAYTADLLAWLDRGRRGRLLPAHAPLLLDRDVLRDLERRLPQAFAETSQRVFRSPRDLVLRILYLLHLTEDPLQAPQHEKIVLSDQGPDYYLVRLDQPPADVSTMLAQIAENPPSFYCINDDLAQPGETHPIIRLTREFLRERAPAAAPFERFSAADYWNARLEQHWGPHGVGSLAYGTAFNRWRDRARRATFHRIVRRFQSSAGIRRVLDVGTGTGEFLRAWAQLGIAEVSGIDFARHAINRLAEAMPDVELRELDARRLPGPFQPGSFDAISAMDVLFHLAGDDDYRQAIRGMAQLLRPEGILLFSENCLPARELQYEQYWRSRTMSRIESDLRDARLEVVAIAPLLPLLNSPVRLPWQWPARAWERLVGIARHGESLGWLLGAALYPFDRILARVLPMGPSTCLVVCRKRSEG